MPMLKETKELLSIVANQKNGPVPAWLPKDAIKRLEGSQPNTERAEAGRLQKLSATRLLI